MVTYGVPGQRFDDIAESLSINIVKAGIFSADRAVTEYADRIWKL